MDLNCCFTTQQLINILMTYSETWWVSDESDRLSDDNNDINIRVWVGSSLTSDSVTSDSGRLKLIILENLIYWLIELLEYYNLLIILTPPAEALQKQETLDQCFHSSGPRDGFTGRVHGTGPRDGSTGRVSASGAVELLMSWRRAAAHDCLFLFERLYVNHVWYQLLEQMKKINKWWVDCSWSVVIQLQTRDPVHNPERRAVHDLSMLNNFI